mmetsp:Transcript_31690/g.69815  ORF Transcript_31690/g.69815 Transcript_31690/m.69815 type:complete len:264 (+) Transcript_31690:913-1704(+)
MHTPHPNVQHRYTGRRSGQARGLRRGAQTAPQAHLPDLLAHEDLHRAPVRDHQELTRHGGHTQAALEPLRTRASSWTPAPHDPCLPRHDHVLQHAPCRRTPTHAHDPPHDPPQRPTPDRRITQHSRRPTRPPTDSTRARSTKGSTIAMGCTLLKLSASTSLPDQRRPKTTQTHHQDNGPAIGRTPTRDTTHRAARFPLCSQLSTLLTTSEFKSQHTGLKPSTKPLSTPPGTPATRRTTSTKTSTSTKQGTTESSTNQDGVADP